MTKKFELTTTEGGGKKHIVNKLLIELVPPEATVDIAAVLTYGAKVKGYGERNWEKGIPFQTLLAAARRHLLKFELGEDTDDESGLSHLSHALANIAMLSALKHRGRKDLDNRLNLIYEESFKQLVSDYTKVIKEP